MLELFGSGILGSIVGGAFRLAPEVLKWLDRTDERKHELERMRVMADVEKARGEQKLSEIKAGQDASNDSGVLAAFKAAIDQQAEFIKGASGKVAALSATVRPVLTYWMWTIYSVAMAAILMKALASGSDAAMVAKLVLTPDFVGMLSGITNYWFLDRTLAKRSLG